MRRLSLSRLLRSRGGAVAPAYVIGFPVVFLLFAVVLEMCFLMMRATMLQRGLDMTLREVRLGNMVNPSVTQLEQQICDRISIFPDCTSSLTLEFTAIDTATFALPGPMEPCEERPATLMQVRMTEVYMTGAPNELMAVRACVLVDTITPFLSEFIEITARTAFVNEPGE